MDTIMNQDSAHGSGRMNFREEAEQIIINAGYTVLNVEPFDGAIKHIRASRGADNFFKFRRDGEEFIVKTLGQKVSGSAGDKIAMFYLNLQEAPCNTVLIVAQTDMVNTFNPLIEFFRTRQITLDHVKVMTLDQLELFVTRRD